MITVIEKKINPTLSAVLSVKLDPYKIDEARIIITQIEIIFPIITFDKTSKIDAKMSPNVDIIKPNRNINFIGIIKILQSGFMVGSCLVAMNLLMTIIDNRKKINKTKL